MTVSVDADHVFALTGDPVEPDLAQFEPDPDGGPSAPDAGTTAPAPLDTASDQWVVWEDPDREFAWAATGLPMAWNTRR
jgi:hypothetical protein